MSAANNISEILAFGHAVDTALAAQIASAGVAGVMPRSREDLPDTYALPLFQKGAASGHLAHLPPGVGQKFEYDLFPGSIVGIEIFSPRIADEKTPEGGTSLAAVYDRLEELAVRVRFALRFGAGEELSARMPYHKLTHLVPLAEVTGFDEERGLDRIELRWSCELGIRSTAWPTTPAGYVLT